MTLLDRLQCPACGASLRAAGSTALHCVRCQATIPVQDGIVALVQARPGTHPAPETHDVDQAIDPDRVEQQYRDIRDAAGARWPDALGTTLEVGCGTGLLSRSLLGHGDVGGVVVTDPSLKMLAACRGALQAAGLVGHVPLMFATLSGPEAGFREGGFDTCAGTSALRHIHDVPEFLQHVFRLLRPGGRAFFLEPNARYHRAIMQALADIVAQLIMRDPTPSPGRHKLLDLLARARRTSMHQGDLTALARLDDRHVFVAEQVEQSGREAGFAVAEALPIGRFGSGAAMAAALCEQMDLGAPLRDQVVGMMPAYASRYLPLLADRDLSPSLLLWFEKSIGPRPARFSPPAADRDAEAAPPGTAAAAAGGVSRHALRLRADPDGEGTVVRLSGWCIANAEVSRVRVRIGAAAGTASPWLPRPDAHAAVNANGVVSNWTSLCCGIEETLHFPELPPDPEGLPLIVELVMAAGPVIRLPAPSRLVPGEEITLKA